MRQKPWILSGLLFEIGFWWAFITRMPRAVSKELMAFHRQEQMDRLKRLLSFGRAPSAEVRLT
jgi:hypothetical protein